MNSEMSDLQKQEYEILKDFIAICEEYSLRYYLVAGSMLGTVRHHGFIPWDDDVDVAMPRPDYEKFLEIAPKVLEKEYYIGTPREKEHVWLATRISSKNEIYSLNNSRTELKTGAWLDVMVVDGAPAPGIRFELHWYHYMFWRALYQMSYFNEIVDLKKERPRKEKILLQIAKVINLQWMLNPTIINAHLEKTLRKYDFDSSPYVATYCGLYRRKEVTPREWYGNGKKYQFEDITVFGLEDSHSYLTQLYGDYMTPPADKVSKHNVRMIKE